MTLEIRRTLDVWFIYLNHMTWGSTWEFPAGLRISCGFRMPWGTGPLFSQALNGWCITDELTDVNWSAGYSEELNNKQQHPSENAKAHWWYFRTQQSAVSDFHISLRNKARQSALMLWEQWNEKTYKQTGSWWRSLGSMWAGLLSSDSRMLCVRVARMPEEDPSWTNLVSSLDLDAVELTEANLTGSLLLPNSTAACVFNQT